MKLILHIGTEKTGTTTIQHFLKINKELLNIDKILVPKSISDNDGNHRWSPVFAYDDDFDDDFTKKNFSLKLNSRKKLIEEKLIEFKKEISNSNSNICIISSEHLSSRLRKIKNITKLKQILDKSFDEISIIIYIRKPISAAISLLSTSIKSGNTPQGLNLQIFSNYLNNLRIIKNWESVFLKKNIKIKLFEKNDFIDGDLIKDFCALCNIKMSPKFKYPNRFNETLNLPQMKYLRYLNQHFPMFVDNKVNIKRGNLTQFIIQNFESPNYFLPTKKEFELFEEYFKDDDNIIKENYFPQKKQLWSTYNKGFTDKKNLINSLTAREIQFLDAIKKIWYKNN